MNRVVSLVMLVAFAAQHLMCCCTGAGAHVCDHGDAANEPICEIAHNHVDDHESKACDHAHCVLPPAESPVNDTSPGDHSHHHHFCVGTHVFFVSAPRAELPASPMIHDFGFESLGCSIQVAMASLAAASRHGVDSGPPHTSCPQRSALCVYRI